MWEVRGRRLVECLGSFLEILLEEELEETDVRGVLGESGVESASDETGAHGAVSCMRKSWWWDMRWFWFSIVMEGVVVVVVGIVYMNLYG